MTEMTDAERAALVAVLDTIKNKAKRGDWWQARYAPIQALHERLRKGAPGA